MSEIAVYSLRAPDPDALWQKLAEASTGKLRPYAFADTQGVKLFDLARVRLPWPEVEPGEPVEITDAETGEAFMATPMLPTGTWLCEVILIDEDGEDLAAISTSWIRLPDLASSEPRH